MILYTSALLAIRQGEPERRSFNAAIEAAAFMSTAAFVEAAIVIGARYGGDGLRDLDLFLAKAEIALVPVDTEQAHAARDAILRFGKGRHPAGLNHGDCYSYALAGTLGEPLLFKGDDFSQTDVGTIAAE